MNKKFEVLCEVFFSDPKSGILMSLVGRIDKLRLATFLNRSEKFLIFKERHHPPIPKTEVKDIVIYRENEIDSEKKEGSSLTKNMKPNYGRII